MEAQLDSTVTGTFGMPAAGLEGSLMIASRPPASRVTKVELPGVGMIHTGYIDGKAWSVDPFMGPQPARRQGTGCAERSQRARRHDAHG